MGYSSRVERSRYEGEFGSLVVMRNLLESARLRLPLLDTRFRPTPLLVQRLDAAEARPNAIEKVLVHGMRGSSQPVVRELPLPLRLDKPHAPQVREVTRDRRLREMKDLHDVAHAEFTHSQHAENTDARRVGESLEHGIEIGDGRRW